MKKILVILGPTATGKSDLAVELALKHDGEIISADSRQVYKGLDIGAGKITKKEMRNVSHHLLDVENPKKTFTVSKFKELTDRKIEDTLNRNKLPIICGGTGFYIQSIVDNIILPEVNRDEGLRKKLKNKSKEELLKILKKLDTKRAQTVDQNNPPRLIRAIEIATHLGHVPPLPRFNLGEKNYTILQIGLDLEDAKLKKNIKQRLDKRLRIGMIKEAEDLHKKGLSWKRMEELGLEYRNLALYLQNKISKEEMQENILIESFQYAKKQRTWFKRDGRIKWFGVKDRKKIEEEVKNFLNVN